MSLAGTLMILVALFTNKWLEGQVTGTSLKTAGEATLYCQESILWNIFAGVFVQTVIKLKSIKNLGPKFWPDRICKNQLQGSILLIHFSLKLWTKPNMMKFKFVIMTFCGFKVPLNQRLSLFINI
jgi:hypothetical protein